MSNPNFCEIELRAEVAKHFLALQVKSVQMILHISATCSDFSAEIACLWLLAAFPFSGDFWWNCFRLRDFFRFIFFFCWDSLQVLRNSMQKHDRLWKADEKVFETLTTTGIFILNSHVSICPQNINKWLLRFLITCQFFWFGFNLRLNGQENTFNRGHLYQVKWWPSILQRFKIRKSSIK